MRTYRVLAILLLGSFLSYSTRATEITETNLPSGVYTIEADEIGVAGALHVSWIDGPSIDATLILNGLSEIVEATAVGNGFWSVPSTWSLSAQPTLFRNYMLKVVNDGGEQIQTAILSWDTQAFEEFLNDRGPTQQNVTIPNPFLEIKLSGYDVFAAKVQIATTKYHVDIGSWKEIYLDQDSHLDSIDIQPEADLWVEPTRTLTIDSSSHNSGTIELQNSSFITGDGRLFNEDSGIIRISDSGTATTSCPFDNEGIIEAQAGKLTLSDDGISFNSGTVRTVEGSQIQIQTHVDNLINGSIEVASNSIISIAIGGQLNSGSLSGNGIFLGDGGGCTGVVNLASQLTVTDNDLNNDGVITVSGMGALLETTSLTDEYKAYGVGGIPLPIHPSEITGGGLIRVSNGAELHLNSLYSKRYVNPYNYGYDRHGIIHNDIEVDSTSKLVSTNLAGGRANEIYGDINLQGEMIVAQDLIVQGEIYSQGSLLLLDSFSFNKLTLNDGSVIASDFVNETESKIHGTGFIEANLTNNGYLAPEAIGTGILQINNSFLQNSSGILCPNISENNQCGQIVVNGTATLNGYLELRLPPNYEPQVGARYTLLTASSISGSFITTNLPPLTTPKEWFVKYNENTVELRVASDTDTDGDGLPDAWEVQQLGTLNQSDGLNDDFDSDGFSDVDEWLAGTNPKNRESFFEIKECCPGENSSNNIVIHWESISNRAYGVYWTESLAIDFTALETNIYFPQSSYTDSVHSADSQGYYKVNVREK